MRIVPAVLTFAGVLSVALTGSAESLTAEENQLLGLINSSRAEAGLAPLQIDAALSAVARAHSLDMATSGFFSHSSPSTGDMGDRLNAGRIRFQGAGENIALNMSVPAAHQALMDSPHHRENLLSPDFNVVGVGIVSNGQQILVTENFIRPGRGFQAVAPSPTLTLPPAEPFVAEPREDDLVRVPSHGGFGGCGGEDDGWEEDAGDDDEHEGFDGGPVTVLPGFTRPPAQVMPSPQAYPMFQVRPAPAAPMVQPSAPQGIWILGPDGAWHPIRVQPFQAQPIRRRFIRTYRYTF